VKAINNAVKEYHKWLQSKRKRHGTIRSQTWSCRRWTWLFVASGEFFQHFFPLVNLDSIQGLVWLPLSSRVRRQQESDDAYIYRYSCYKRRLRFCFETNTA